MKRAHSQTPPVLPPFEDASFFELVQKINRDCYSTSEDIVKYYKLPFRRAYQITSKIVNYAESKSMKLNELTLKELKKIEPKLNEDILKVFDLENSIKSKKSYGGTSFENVKKMIKKYKKESK